MGTIWFPPNCHLYNFLTGVKSSLVSISILLPVIFFKTELLHSHLYLPYSGYETGGLVWLTSELAVLGGNVRACVRRRKYIASFLLGKTDQPVES